MRAEAVLEAKEFLASLGVWPEIPAEINPAQWLEGFHDGHRAHAVALLDSFIYLSSRQVRKMFESGVHSLSGEICSTFDSYASKKSGWQDFLHRAVFSMPTGETPSPADSGFAFMRMARNVLQVDESRLVLPEHLPAAMSTSPQPSALIFIDDFVGSGEQFTKTWTREIWAGHLKTVEEVVADCQIPVYYVPLIATQYAVDRLMAEAPSVKLRPSHVLSDEYSILHPNSVMLPADLRTGARRFVEDASTHAGIVRDYVFGFHDLALGVAFADSIPDASIALYWSREGTWQPLIARP